MVPIHLIWDKSDKYSPKISKICPKLDPNEISHEEQAEDGWRMGWALNANRKRQPKKTMMDDSKHSNSSFCIMRDNAVINTWIHRSIKIHTCIYVYTAYMYVHTWIIIYIIFTILIRQCHVYKYIIWWYMMYEHLGFWWEKTWGPSLCHRNPATPLADSWWPRLPPRDAIR